METIVQLSPWLSAMVVLAFCSGFFSASEAAMFSLRPADRRRLRKGNPAQRLAAGLLDDPDRLLSAVLFWNLATNLAYFAIASLVGLELERNPAGGQSAALVFGTLSLLSMIICSEMVPESVGVLAARPLCGVMGAPLALAVRAVDPIMPVLQLACVLSRRLAWPTFTREAYLEVSDLERAIQLSTSDAALIDQEQAALRNIVLLSDIRVDEWMRPRTQFKTFRPPVMLDDLEGQIPPGGYLLVSEPETEEVASAIHLKELHEVPLENLEQHAEPVVYLPWCATVADALQQVRRLHRQVVVIVNEFGETIGILTLEDLLDTVFTYYPSRSKLLLDRKPIHDLGGGAWLVAGVTSLRRLSRYLNVEVPVSKSVTVAGVIQESLGRLAADGDHCRWGPLDMKVLEAPQRGHMLIEVTVSQGPPGGAL